jgi:restriction system protein
LMSVEAERSAFNELVLAAVDPAACLKHLNALVSPNPFDLEAVELSALTDFPSCRGLTLT